MECTVKGRRVEEGSPQEDRLGQLPDDILLCILARCVLRDAVRTSVLSKRWRHLPGMRTHICLDAASFQPRKELAKYTMDVLMDDLVRSNIAAVEATKSILAHKSQYTIEILAISFYLRDEAIDIVRSVDQAMANRDVVTLFFAFNAEFPIGYCTDDLKLIYGRRFMTFFDACPRAFGGLQGLHIQSVSLGESDIPNVLSTCKKLTDLTLEDCDSGVRSVLQIEHPQLFKLKMSDCGFERVELIWLPRLEELVFWSWMEDQYPLSFGYVPELWKLTLSNANTTLHKTFELSELFGNANIDALDLDFICQRIWIQPKGPRLLAPLLQHLQIVGLHRIHEKCDLTWTLFFLQAACLLKRIYIEAWDHTCNEEYNEQKRGDDELLKWEVPDGFKHYNLSQLIIKGFQAEERFTRYIRRVMKAAVNLATIALSDSRSCTFCQFHPATNFPRTNEERDQTRQQISEWRPSPIKIMFDI